MDKDSLEFFVSKSKELLQVQSDSFVASHTKAATITAMLSIFIPLFFSSIVEGNRYVLYVSGLPIVCMITSVVLMLFVLRPTNMQTSLNISAIERLKEEKIELILEKEVAANFNAVEINEQVVATQHKLFKTGLFLAVMSIILSVILLYINSLIK